MSAPTTVISPRTLVTALALTGLAIMVWRISDALLVGFGGIVLGATLRALMRPWCRITGWSEKAGLAGVLVTLVVVGGLASWLFGHQIATQATELQQLLPQQIKRVTGALHRWDITRTLVESLQSSATDSKTLAGVGLAAGALLNAILDLVLILFLGIYLALDPGLYVSGVLRLVPPRRRAQVRGALGDAGEDLRRWLLAQLIAMATVGVAVGACLTILGVPLAMLLGAVAFLLEFVPVIGPIIFAAPGILVALSKGPRLALYTALAYLVVQQLESNILIPLLQRWAVHLPPVVSLLAVVACGLLFGPMGVVFATPLAVVAIALVKHLYVEDTLEHGAASAPRSKNRRT